jgi:hypothetical protein
LNWPEGVTSKNYNNNNGNKTSKTEVNAGIRLLREREQKQQLI